MQPETQTPNPTAQAAPSPQAEETLGMPKAEPAPAEQEEAADFDEPSDEISAEALTEASAAPTKNPSVKENLYDKIPVTYRQVDIFVKVLLGIVVILLVVGTILGNR